MEDEPRTSDQLPGESDSLRRQVEEWKEANSQKDRTISSLQMRVEELERWRRQYLFALSHDLRNPLTPVIGQAALLQRRLLQLGLTAEAERAAAIVKNSQRLNDMILQLAEAGYLEAEILNLQTEPTDLRGLLEELAGGLASPEEPGRLQFNLPEDSLPALVDRERIRKAISNLISNALKYSPTDSRVVVTAARQEGNAIISVSDQGHGIPEGEIPRLFDRFYRGSSSRPPHGLGLGLHITRMIVEAHGGRVWAESQPGNGSTFSMALPLHSPPTHSP